MKWWLEAWDRRQREWHAQRLCGRSLGDEEVRVEVVRGEVGGARPLGGPGGF